VLNLSALVVGLVIAPRRLFRAFVRGRHSENLYLTAGEWSEALLELKVGELRRKLGLADDRPRATPSDVAAFALWGVAAVVYATYLPALAIWLLS
jgi:hypothetical protein